MKVLLVNPRAKASIRKENLGLAYLAGCLEADGHKVRVADEVSGQDVDEAVRGFGPDIVGITSMTMHAPRAYQLADDLRGRGLPVVLGGAHPSAMPEEALEHADCVIRGEGELSFPAILRSGKVEGIIEPDPPMDLDAIPLPARGHLNLDYYASGGEELAGFSYRTLGLITSRGCPFRCIFCGNSKREVKLRFHSPERVVEEMSILVRDYGIESVAFYDELMATNLDRLRRICELMIERGLDKLRWECQAHPRTLKADILPLMKRAGCIQVGVGFESGSQHVLDTIQKNSTVEMNYEVARMVHDAGLRLRGCFIVGVPGETQEDIRATAEFIRKVRCEYAGIHFLTPFPGSALYDSVADRISASGITWDRFTAGDPSTFTTNDAMTPDEQRRAFETLLAAQALRNFSFWGVVRRSLKDPRHALRLARRLLFPG